MEQKRRAVVSYDNMSEELAAAFAAKYPKGVIDYLPDIKKVTKPDGTDIYTVEVEIPSAIYLVKINIKVDDPDEVDKWLDAENDGEEAENENPEGSGELPDDNISQYGEDNTDAE